MKPLKAVLVLSVLTAVLALLAAGAGLLWQGEGGPYTFTTLRGEAAEIYGQGLYRYDTLFIRAGSRGTDTVTLFLGVPLLLFSAWLYRRGSLKGALLLVGTLAYFFYVYASYALGTVAYNELFLVYVALFSASLFAFILAFRSVYPGVLSSRFSVRMPRRGLAAFMFVSGLVTLFVWGEPLVSALVSGGPPERMDTYTTPVTYALDLAIITPAVFLVGVLVLRRDPLGYLIAFSLLVVEAMLAPVITAQTVSQVSAGVEFTPAEMVGPVAGFVVLALVALWFMAAILRGIPDSEPVRPARVP